jgi:hypothetical protein
MKVLGGMLMIGLGCCCAIAAELLDVSEQALADLGSTYGQLRRYRATAAEPNH